MNSEKPWWAPDAQGFLAFGIVAICGIALFMRMLSPTVIDDKMLETMLTILFSTCLVTVYNFSFGSSRGSQTKDDTQNKIVDKMIPPPIPPSAVPGTIITTITPAIPAEKTTEIIGPKV